MTAGIVLRMCFSLTQALNGNMHDNHKGIDGQNASVTFNGIVTFTILYAVSSNVQCSLLGIFVCCISSGCLKGIRSVIAVSSAVDQNDLEYVWQALRDCKYSPD